jgi:uncharacterized protein YqfB (UPF0267 family)
MAAVVLRFRSSLAALVIDGRKTQTLRRGVGALRAGAVVGAGCRYDRPAFATLRIESVDAVLVWELDDVDVQREAAGSLDALRAALRATYPRADALVRVRFELVALDVSASAWSSAIASPR